MSSIRYNLLHSNKKDSEGSKADQNVIQNLLYGLNEESKESKELSSRPKSQAAKRSDHYKKIKDRHSTNKFSYMEISQNDAIAPSKAKRTEKVTNQPKRTKTSEKVGRYFQL